MVTLTFGSQFRNESRLADCNAIDRPFRDLSPGIQMQTTFYVSVFTCILPGRQDSSDQTIVFSLSTGCGDHVVETGRGILFNK